MTEAGVVRCDECGWETSTELAKPFDPCPKCPTCDKCGHRPEGKFRLMFDYPSGKPSIYEAGRND